MDNSLSPIQKVALAAGALLLYFVLSAMFPPQPEQTAIVESITPVPASTVTRCTNHKPWLASTPQRRCRVFEIEAHMFVVLIDEQTGEDVTLNMPTDHVGGMSPGLRMSVDQLRLQYRLN